MSTRTYISSTESRHYTTNDNNVHYILVIVQWESVLVSRKTISERKVFFYNNNLHFYE